MAADEQQFYQLLECLMSLDNNVRQQAEVDEKPLLRTEICFLVHISFPRLMFRLIFFKF